MTFLEILGIIFLSTTLMSIIIGCYEFKHAIVIGSDEPFFEDEFDFKE